MKLAEALLVRSDVQKKLSSLKQRVVNNAVVQEGNAPHEDPKGLMNTAFSVMKELESIVLKINKANQTRKLKDGRTLAEAIAQRETLASEHSLIQQAIQGSHKEPDRYSMSEIRWVATVDVANLQKKSEKLSKEIRELNVLIQEENWKAEI